MKNNAELQRDVQDAINWEPTLRAATIGVAVRDSIVTLTGVVDSYARKIDAENAANSVAGVQAVVEKIEVKRENSDQKDDHEIADEILHAFRWNNIFPKDLVKVKVEDGWVTLEGELPWNYQKDRAKHLVAIQAGVNRITNNITIKPDGTDALEKTDIENALKRNWSIIDKDICVEVAGHQAILTGTVDSIYQKNEAGRVAWNAPGVWTVANELSVE